MKILLADDHELFSSLLKRILEDSDSDLSVQTFRNFNDAFDAVRVRRTGGEHPYKLIILDMNMPGMDGLKSVQRMRTISGDCPIAIVSGLVKEDEARELMREGLAGFLPKTIKLTEMREALAVLLKGGRYFPPMAKREARASPIGADPTSACGDSMTSRERAVLSEVVQGWSNKRIAENLGITEMTVKTHLYRVFRKLGARNRTDAVRIVTKMHTDAAAGDTSAQSPAG
jgi:two-component system, NarL family, nitrate/nitrite response regulator NarL